MRDVGLSSLLDDGSIEVPVMAINKLTDTAGLHAMRKFVVSMHNLINTVFLQD